jgi:hypothetical protein
MSRRERFAVAALACAIHLAILVPSIGEQGGVLNTDFGPEAEAIESGDLPYRDQELEYPPLSIPVIVGPALVGEGLDAYNDAFEWEMLAFDLAIVLMLALGLGGDRRRVLGALAVYTVGVVALSGIVLGGSDIDEAPLALGRFDLVPAALVLAAVLAREAGRSATWSALLSMGVAVKAFPLALFPSLMRGERNPKRVAVAAAVPVLVCAAIVLAWGDEFTSAISYHTERGLQIESVAATPLEIAGLNDVDRAAQYGSGSFNFTGPGSDLARALSIGALVFMYGLVLWAGWRSSVSQMRLATALLAVIVVLSPVLSPQFLFWLLPISAAAYGFAIENLVLLAGFVLTQLMLQFYARVVVDFDPEFVWRLAGRNAVLLIYLGMVCVPIVREGIAARGPEGGLSRSAL